MVEEDGLHRLSMVQVLDLLSPFLVVLGVDSSTLLNQEEILEQHFAVKE